MFGEARQMEPTYRSRNRSRFVSSLWFYDKAKLLHISFNGMPHLSVEILRRILCSILEYSTIPTWRLSVEKPVVVANLTGDCAMSRMEVPIHERNMREVQRYHTYRVHNH